MSSYLQWNPDPIAFTLPWIHRPIKWYGILFAIGFFIAYQLGRMLLKTFLSFRKKLSLSDIKSWEGLFQDLKYKRSAHFLWAFFSKEFVSFIQKSPRGTAIPKHFQVEVMEGLNQSFHPDYRLSYTNLANRWHRLVQKWAAPQLRPWIEHRFALEELLSGGLHKTEIVMGLIAEKLVASIFLGMVIGARLGHLLFYRNPSEYLSDPLLVLKVWEGGLSSHGATIGILLMLIFTLIRLRKRFSFLSLAWILDIVVIPTSFAACFIRLGNFVNQELVGKATGVPWAIIFHNPAEGLAGIPRHPVQLYEALGYFLIGLGLLFWVYRCRGAFRVGKIAGVFFISVFSLRFVVDFFKERLSVYDMYSFIAMGQLLSIPLICFGAFLFFRKRDQGQTLFLRSLGDPPLMRWASRYATIAQSDERLFL